MWFRSLLWLKIIPSYFTATIISSFLHYLLEKSEISHATHRKPHGILLLSFHLLGKFFFSRILNNELCPECYKKMLSVYIKLLSNKLFDGNSYFSVTKIHYIVHFFLPLFIQWIIFKKRWAYRFYNIYNTPYTLIYIEVKTCRLEKVLRKAVIISKNRKVPWKCWKDLGKTLMFEAGLARR